MEKKNNAIQLNKSNIIRVWLHNIWMAIGHIQIGLHWCRTLWHTFCLSFKVWYSESWWSIRVKCENLYELLNTEQNYVNIFYLHWFLEKKLSNSREKRCLKFTGCRSSSKSMIQLVILSDKFVLDVEPTTIQGGVELGKLINNPT